jgi:hypothetical protein
MNKSVQPGVGPTRSPPPNESQTIDYAKLITELNEATDELRKARAQAMLTPATKEAIRAYMFRIVIPSGVALGVVTGLVGYLAGDAARIAELNAKIEADKKADERVQAAYDKADVKLQASYKETNDRLLAGYDNVAQAKQIATQVATDANDIKDRLQKASTEALQSAQEISRSRKEVKDIVEGQYDNLAKVLYENPGFKIAVNSFNESRLQDITKTLADLGALKFIAAGEIRGGQLVVSTKGVDFNLATGRVSFPNPDNAKVLPLVSTLSPSSTYITTTCYVKEIGLNFVAIGENALDTGGRNTSASNCAFTILSISGK